MRVLFGVLLAIVVSGCATKVTHVTTYRGEGEPLPGWNGATVLLETTVKDDKGADVDRSRPIYAQMAAVLMTALERHGMKPVQSGPAQFRLVTTLDPVPGKQLWRAEPQRAKNMGAAVVPVVGLFTPRYYEVSTAFGLRMALLDGERRVAEDSTVVEKAEEVSVSMSNRTEESVKAAMNLWDAERDRAIRRFFVSLSKAPRQVADAK